MPGIRAWSVQKMPQPFRCATRLRTSRHKVAGPQKTRACVLAVARKITRSQTRTRKATGSPRSCSTEWRQVFSTGGTRRVREVAAPLPDSGDRTNPNRKTVGAAHTRWGLSAPRPPRGFLRFGGAGSTNRSDVAEQQCSQTDHLATFFSPANSGKKASQAAGCASSRQLIGRRSYRGKYRGPLAANRSHRE